MNIEVRQLAGILSKNILLEKYYYKGYFDSIISIYVNDGSKYYGIICSEGNITLHVSDECPESISDGDCRYQIEELEEEMLKNYKVDSVIFIGSEDWTYGIVLLFDNGHNLVFYNTDYAEGDEDIFEIDTDISAIEKRYGLFR